MRLFLLRGRCGCCLLPLIEVQESQLAKSRLALLLCIMFDILTSVALMMVPWMSLRVGRFGCESLPWSLRAMSLLLIEFCYSGCCGAFADALPKPPPAGLRSFFAAMAAGGLEPRVGFSGCDILEELSTLR